MSAGVAMVMLASMAIGCGEDGAQSATEACDDPSQCAAPRLEVLSGLATFSNRTSRTRDQVVTVGNVGTAATVITALEIRGGPTEAFLLRIEGVEEATRLELDRSLEPQGALDVDIRFVGNAFGVATATLAVITTDPDVPALEVELVTVDERPELTLSDYDLTFDVPVGRMERAVVQIINDGDLEARVDAVSRLGSPDFEVSSPALPHMIAPGDALPLDITYWPRSTGDSTEAHLVVRYIWGGNEARDFALTTELRGLTDEVVTDCLAAVALGEQTRDAEGNAIVDPLGLRDTLEVERGATVRVTGRQSSDPDGDAIAGYRWRVAQVPPDFVLDFADSADVAQHDLELLQVGTYAFELDVFDGNDETSCEPARVEIAVVNP